MRRWPRSLWLLAVAFASNPADAADVVVVVAPKGDATLQEAAQRLQAELEVAGFTPRPLYLSGNDVRSSLEEWTRKHSASIGVSLLPVQSASHVELWVRDRVTGKTLIRQLDLRDVPQDQVASVVSLHAYELLQASLAEVTLARESPAKDAAGSARVVDDTVPPNRAIQNLLPKSAPSVNPWKVRLGAGAFSDLALHTLELGPTVAIGRQFAERFTTGLFFFGPSFGATVEAEGTTTEVRYSTGGAFLEYRPWNGVLTPHAGVSVGMGHLSAQGRTTESEALVPARDDAWSAAFGVGVGVQLQVSRNASALLDLGGQWTIPRHTLATEERALATVDRFVSARLCAQLAF